MELWHKEHGGGGRGVTHLFKNSAEERKHILQTFTEKSLCSVVEGESSSGAGCIWL